MNEFGLSFHHLGLIVQELSQARSLLEGLGYTLNAPPVKGDQTLYTVAATHDRMPMVDVICAAESDKPLDDALQSRAPGLRWHICYMTDDLARSLQALADAMLEPQRIYDRRPVALYPARTVSIYRARGIDLIEILEVTADESSARLMGTKERLAADLAGSAAVARQAEADGNYRVALSAWEYVRACFPSEPLGYLAAAALLKQRDQEREANSIVLAGVARCPSDAKLAELQGWIHHSSGNLFEADRSWTTFRRRFPNEFAGYYGGGAILRAIGQYDQADALYEGAMKRWPSAANLRSDYAAVAQARGDLKEALKRWTELRAAFPDYPDAYIGEARSYRDARLPSEAERVIEEAAQRFPGCWEVLLEFARVAEQCGCTHEALKRWEAVIAASYGLPDGYLGATRVLIDAGRFRDAENALSPALRLFPNSAAVAELNAAIAYHRGDYSESLQRWAALRERFPDNVQGYIGGVNAFLSLSKTAEAEALINDAKRCFPDDINIAATWAGIPSRLQSWGEASERWGSVCDRFPSAWSAQSSYAEALAKSGKVDYAEDLLSKMLAREGQDIVPMRIYAECANERREWDKAEGRWRQIVETYPNSPIGWIGLAEMLSRAGRVDESRAILTLALQRIPGNGDLAQHLAKTETARRDWPTALRLWSDLRRKYPYRPSVLSDANRAVAEARTDLELAARDGDVPPFQIPSDLMEVEEDSSAVDSKIYRLLMKFESIGDSCEFGILQRRFGAEPISLLRWASTAPRDLAAALRTGMSGVGEPEFTVVEAVAGEYTTRDRRYHMFSHTFIPETAERIEKFTVQHLRRMQYLRRKFIDDLALGEKILVYKSNQGLTDDQAREIFRAIRTYGGNPALLCVRLTNDDRIVGTVEQSEDGLFMGHIDRFSTVDINVNLWVTLCRQVESQWRPKAR